jgi:hypothetical protein
MGGSPNRKGGSPTDSDENGGEGVGEWRGLRWEGRGAARGRWDSGVVETVGVFDPECAACTDKCAPRLPSGSSGSARP